MVIYELKICVYFLLLLYKMVNAFANKLQWHLKRDSMNGRGKQSGAVITRSNIASYFIHHNSESGVKNTVCAHKMARYGESIVRISRKMTALYNDTICSLLKIVYQRK